MPEKGKIEIKVWPLSELMITPALLYLARKCFLSKGVEQHYLLANCLKKPEI